MISIVIVRLTLRLLTTFLRFAVESPASLQQQKQILTQQGNVQQVAEFPFVPLHWLFCCSLDFAIAHGFLLDYSQLVFCGLRSAFCNLRRSIPQKDANRDAQCLELLPGIPDLF